MDKMYVHEFEIGDISMSQAKAIEQDETVVRPVTWVFNLDGKNNIRSLMVTTTEIDEFKLLDRNSKERSTS